jgi:hypothetical protein
MRVRISVSGRQPLGVSKHSAVVPGSESINSDVLPGQTGPASGGETLASELECDAVGQSDPMGYEWMRIFYAEILQVGAT